MRYITSTEFRLLTDEGWVRWARHVTRIGEMRNVYRL